MVAISSVGSQSLALTQSGSPAAAAGLPDLSLIHI